MHNNFLPPLPARTLDVSLSINEAHSLQLFQLTSEPLLGRVVNALAGHGSHHLIHELCEGGATLGVVSPPDSG